MSARIRGEERGAVAVVVAISMTVIFGMGALVVDVGALYQERREVQNGADAAVLAVAEDCAYDDCGDTFGTAEALADPNAEDDTTTVDDVAVDSAARTATVDTSTAEAGGGSIVAYSFARWFGFAGETVHASATARWGPLGRAKSLPLVVSWCEWERTVGNPSNLPSGTTTLGFHEGNTTEECNGPAGQDVPGGFGWIDSSDCEAQLEVDGGVWAGSDPGVNVPQGCSPSAIPLGEPVLVPIFDSTTGQGQGARFHLVGFAAFELDGFKLHPGQPGWQVGSYDCAHGNEGGEGGGGGPAEGGPGGGNQGLGDVCITGTFVRFVSLDAVIGSSMPDLGARTVELIE